ncbi:guanylin [Mesocricetus auratus]|uniref:Guanylin n=1 Tax=Mesocricetus auratus TaxID=10036 RepID=A0A1U7QYR5_MESAU|nr:guanylin [Mesocricetus auratus]
MNACLLSMLCLLGALAVLVEGVTVQDGDLSFPLESVKQLKDLKEVPELVSHKRFAPRPPVPLVPRLCSYTAFPEALRPLCKKPNAEEILQRLKAIAQDPNTCEICAYAACTGC